MTLEEKIEHLRTASMEEARAEGNKIISQHKSSIDQIFEDHKEVALRQSELSIKTETNNARQQLNKALSTSQTQIKREQSKCQHKLKTRLFDRVRVLLDEYMQTPAYDELLVSYIEKSKEYAGAEEMTIYINPSDESKKADLEAKTGVTLTISNEDFIGGTRTIMRARNILIDRSFSSSLAEEYDRFLFSGGETNA